MYNVHACSFTPHRSHTAYTCWFCRRFIAACFKVFDGVSCPFGRPINLRAQVNVYTVSHLALAMLSIIPVYLQWLLIGSVVALLQYGYTLHKRSHHLPPGPQPCPFIGNALTIPRKNLGPEFNRLSQRYGEKPHFTCISRCSDALPGDVVYLNALGQSMVILGSYSVARELLEKRSANYSDRPQSVMAKLYVLRVP